MLTGPLIALAFVFFLWVKWLTEHQYISFKPSRYTGRHRLPRRVDAHEGASDAWAATVHVWAMQGEREGLFARSSS